MPRLQSRQIFQPSCPSGGTWYSCGGGSKFVGCCTRDPCNSVGCADGNLRAASFNTDYYGNFSDAVCPSNSQFYTCTATDPPFLGCCKQNACRADGNAGCPQADLTAASLPDNAAQASAYSPTGGPSSTSSATSAPSSSSSSSTAGIVGGVIGAVAVLLIVIGALLWRRRQQRKKKAAAAGGTNTINEADGRPISEMGGVGVMGSGSGKPPRYSSLTNPGSPNPYAMELDGFPRKAPHEQQTPSELASGDDHQLHAELPGDESGGAVVLHELEGSSPGTTFTGGTPATVSTGSPSSKKASHSRGSSWSSFVERRAARRASGGGGGGNTTGPTGLAIQGLHPYSQVGRGNNNNNGGSPRSSPRSPSFPHREGGDDAGSESGVSSLPSTPRSAYGYGPGAGTMGGYSDVSRLSPTYPPPIREEERYRDRDDDDGDVSDGNRNERR
ncbi:hypothetical protein BFW01_g10652 [Lasiodiplodia theobromae]|uniref:Epidermal growth factor receptor-like transmembrane-juxtamembrane segment domain-containing protein n=1 Tax=Lasiodiplodia theobromae TaxID=45133 RepID=A0A8H7IPW4_9PEZI|nr:hypothetical protein BFW01_g10652 [Lasiodiplodia theobromae]